MDPYCFQVSDKEPRLKYQRSSEAKTTSSRGNLNCFKEQLRGFLVTFEWCHISQRMLISIWVGAYLCIPECLNRQSMQVPRLPDHPAPSIASLSGQLAHVCNLRDWWPTHVFAFSSSFRPITCALLRPFHEHICTANSADFLWGVRLFDN